MWQPAIVEHGNREDHLYLAAADYRRLKALAATQGRPAAELIRDAVSEYAERHSPASLPTSLGAGRSGAGAIATLDLRDFEAVELRGSPRLLPRDLSQ